MSGEMEGNGVSEVARLKQQIDLECRASWAALSALRSGTAQHRFITARLRKMDMYHGQLVKLVGEEQAIAYLCEAFEPKEGEQ